MLKCIGRDIPAGERGVTPGVVSRNCVKTTSRQMFAPVRTLKLQDWSKRNNPRRIDVIVRDVIVAFDVVEIDGLRNDRLLIEVT